MPHKGAPFMQTHSSIKSTHDSADQSSSIRKFLDDYEQASNSKDLEGLIALYSPDHTAFDVVPPFSRHGNDAARQAFQQWFGMYSGPLQFSFEDVQIYSEGSLAVVHALTHIKGDEFGKMSDGWSRSTLVLKNENGKWRIIHDHASMPFDMKTMKPIMNPDAQAKH